MEIKLTNNIGKIAAEKGVLPLELSRGTGLTPGNIYAITNGSVDPNFLRAATLWRIALVLGVSVDELLTVENTQNTQKTGRP